MDTIGVSYYIGTLVFLISISAFFSASETSIFSLSKIRLMSMAEDNIRNAKKLLKLLEKPDELLTTILVLNNLVNILTSSIATMLMMKLCGDFGVSIATGATTILVLIFGEITPKTLAIDNAEKIALIIAPIMECVVFLLKPIVCIFNKISKLMLKFSKNKNTNRDILTEDEIKTLVNVSEENGVLNVSEKEMICNVFDFDETLVKDIMVPRIHIVGIEVESTYEDIINLIRKEKYSRIPVYKKSIDNIIGILNIKDMVFEDINKECFKLNEFLRDTFNTYEFKKINDLLKEMKKNKTHMAVVLDEYGGTKGIVTMEDLIEEIMGDIDDEYDTAEDKDILKISPKEYVSNGSAKIHDVIEITNLDISPEETEYDSIGGFIIKYLGRFPSEGETLAVSNGIISILETDKNTIRKIKIKRTT